jgi:hypothetical protein
MRMPHPGTRTTDVGPLNPVNVVATPVSLTRTNRLLLKSAMTTPVPEPVSHSMTSFARYVVATVPMYAPEAAFHLVTRSEYHSASTT